MTLYSDGADPFPPLGRPGTRRRASYRRGSGRKTATHFSWNRSVARLLLIVTLFALPSAVLLFVGEAFAAETSSMVARPYAAATGRADAPQIRIVVPARDIMRGEVIGESDLTFADVSTTATPATTVTKFEALTGMQARRMLRAGQSIRPDDVRRPVVVTKGQTVTMIFSAPGVELAATGRAMSEGGVGDTVTIQNPASFRMISATVTGPGAVRAANPATAAFTTARR
jgi:flagella basal body P-ring formation protein FlgA